MPQFDGTGPAGRGPRTGRGRGVCGSGIRSNVRSRNRGFTLLSFAVPVVTAAIRDFTRPDNVTRRLFGAVKTKLIGSAHIRTISDTREISNNSTDNRKARLVETGEKA